MASFLQKNNPWIESTILYAASFQGGDDNDDNQEDKEIEEEEPQTENTIPSGLLPSPPKRRHGIINNNGSNNVVVDPTPPSRRGKIVQVIQRGGDFDWQRTLLQRSRLGNDDDDDGYCPPYLVIHDGLHSIIAFLSPTTLEGIVSSSTIISNRSLVSITNYTVSTILQCCQKQIPCQHQKRSHQQQQDQQKQQHQSFDFEMHSQILSHLYFTTTCNHTTMANSSRNTNHTHHHHEPNGYTLIPPEIQSQLPHQITNNQLYLCLYIQGQVSMIGAENQGLIGHPKDVHCSPKLRRELMKLEEEEKEEEEDLRENTQRKVREDSYSHHVLIMKLEAVHRYYYSLDQKKNGNKEVVMTVDGDEEEDEDFINDDDDDDDDEWEGERQGHPPRGRGGIIRGGKTRKQFGRQGRKKRDKDDHARRRVATRSQTYHSTTLSTKSIPTNSAISLWPWKSRSSVESRSFTSTRDAAAPRDAADDSDHEDESKIVSAMPMMQNSRPGKDGSATAVNEGEEEQPGMNAAVSQTRARGGDIPITEATTPTTTTTASMPRPPMGNVQELFELGVDIEEFLGLESQSDSDDNAVSAAAATTTTISAAADVGDGNDDHDIDIEGREFVKDGTIGKSAGRHKLLDTNANRQQQRRRQHQSPGRESTCSSTQGTAHESSFVGINDMLVDEESDAMEDNGGDDQNDENRDEIVFEDGGGNYDDLDESEQFFQTQPESLANYNETQNNNRIGARKTVEALEYQIPLSTTRKKRADQQQLVDMGAEVVVTGLSSRRNPTRKKKSRRRRMEDEDEEEDNYPVPLSQRKLPPETLECITMESQISPQSQREASNTPYASEGEKEHEEEDEYSIPLSQRKAPPEAPRGRIVLESQIPLPPRMASKEPVARVGEEEDSEAENRAVGRQSQIPISTKTRPVQYSRKKPNNSAASIMTPSKVSRKEIYNSEDEDFSDDNWMRVRKSTKQCDREDSDDDEDSNDWMKVRQTTKQNKRHHTAEDDNNLVDDYIDFDNVAVVNDVDDDSSDEAYEPESQVAGEGSEEIVSPTSLRIMPTSRKEARGKRVNEYSRNHVRFAKNPSTEGKYDATAFSSKASIMLGFASSKKSIQKKVGQKKARGEQFDVASFVDKAQRLCGL